MRNEYYDDYEQSQAVKKWIKDNTPTMVFGVVLGVGLLMGWRYWDGYKIQKAVAAADSYSTVTETLGSQELETAQLTALVDDYVDNHGANGYASLIAMQLAKKLVEQQDYLAAAEQYRQIITFDQPIGIADIARLRLARVQLQLGQLDDSLSTLATVSNDEHEAAIAMIRGDVLLAKGDASGARSAYEKADELAEQASQMLIQMKLNDLAVEDPVELGDSDASTAGNES